MTEQHAPQPLSARITISRWVLLLLATLFTLGAFGQFLLAGLSFFDDATRWKDHETLGYILGLLPWVMWIPAALGKTGARVVGATMLLFILFEAQYAFINVDNTIAQAFHPLNGSVLLVLGFWITLQSVSLVRGVHRPPSATMTSVESSIVPDKLEGSRS